MKVEFKKVQLAFVYRTIFFPFTYPEMHDSLKKEKYELEPITPKMPATMPSGTAAYLAGHVATKNDCKILLDDIRKILVIAGKVPSKVRSIYEEIGRIAQKDFGVDSKAIDYVELIVDAHVTPDKEPISTMQELFKDIKILKKFDEILEEETSIFEIRIASKGADPNSKNWFDVRVMPLITNPKLYYVRLVYRAEEIEKVDNFTNKLQPKIESLIKELGS